MVEFDLETIKDKPWRKPGADISDYFNYGFTEDTWKVYCARHLEMRKESVAKAEIKVMRDVEIGCHNRCSKLMHPRICRCPWMYLHQQHRSWWDHHHHHHPRQLSPLKYYRKFNQKLNKPNQCHHNQHLNHRPSLMMMVMISDVISVIVMMISDVIEIEIGREIVVIKDIDVHGVEVETGVGMIDVGEADRDRHLEHGRMF